MRLRWLKGKMLLIPVVMVALFAGYATGRIVEAQTGVATPVPGSAQDPLVSKSLAEKMVSDTVTDLRDQVNSLTARTDELGRIVGMLEAQKESSPLVTGEKLRKGSLNVDIGNMRSGPDTSFIKVASLTKGTIVTILAEQGDWFRILLADSQTGWLHKSLVLLRQ